MSQLRPLSLGEKRTLLSIARKSLECCVRGAPVPAPESSELTDALCEKRGAFVTLSAGGALRGCIGYVEPVEPLWRAVMANAEHAALYDNRFTPVTPDELDAIHIEISAMSPLRCIEELSEIEIGTHGLMITRDACRGLLLPQVATEYGWTCEEFLCHTCRKAGLPAHAWNDSSCRIEIFSAEVFGEDDPLLQAS